MRGRKPTEFERGALITCSVIVAQHDEPSIAEDAASDMGLSGIDVSDFSEFDARNLHEMCRQGRGRVKLYGLRKAMRSGQ